LTWVSTTAREKKSDAVRELAPNSRRKIMKALTDFFSTDYGLLSAAVIAFMLGMGVFFVRFFLKSIREDAARAQQR